MAWMAWTLPTALFFAGIALLLVVMVLIELRWPTQLARGFLPIVTTRGDRVFISLLSAGFIHIAWLGFFGSGLPWASLLAVLWAVVVLRWG